MIIICDSYCWAKRIIFWVLITNFFPSFFLHHQDVCKHDGKTWWWYGNPRRLTHWSVDETSKFLHRRNFRWNSNNFNCVMRFSFFPFNRSNLYVSLSLTLLTFFNERQLTHQLHCPHLQPSIPSIKKTYFKRCIRCDARQKCWSYPRWFTKS